jgi:hypothetical protein
MKDLENVRSHLLQTEAKVFQHPRAYALSLPEQSQEQVFGTNILVLETTRFVVGKLHHVLGVWGQTDFAGHEVISIANDTLDGLTRLLEIHTQMREHVRGHTIPLTKQAQQEVLGADGVVVEALCFFLGETHDFAGTLGEPVKAPPPVLTCTSSRSAGTSPAVTRQPSHDGVNNCLYCHLLILSVD